MTEQKVCPRCGALAAITAAYCQNCGHKYRTVFVPPVQPSHSAQIMPPAYSPPKPFPLPSAYAAPAPVKARRTSFFVFLSIIGGVFVAGLVGTCMASLGNSAKEEAPQRAVAEARPPTATDPIHGAYTNRSARDIASRIQVGMEMTDVVEIAGGYGNMTGGGRPKNWIRMEYPDPDGTVNILYSYRGMVDAETQIGGKEAQMPIWIVEQVDLK